MTLASAPAAAVRVVLYCRISQDGEGQGLGVARQEADCRHLAERRGWDVADVYVDNDLSAYSGKTRPAYRRLLGEIEAGRVEAVVAWHPDWLHRSPVELEAFIDLVERSGVAVETVQAGRVDLATPAGRMNARMLGTVARYESEHRSDRIRRKHRELAEAGKVSGGGNRPFGFERDRITHRPVEVELVREAARRVLVGESLYRIAADWTARGVDTSTGAPWSTTALKAFLIAPRIAGLRSHRGEVVGPAVWEPILGETTWKRVTAVLTDPGRKRKRPIRSYLLTGLLHCARCGTAMVATPRIEKTGGGKRGVYIYGKGATVRAYGCAKTSGGCGGVFIVASGMDAFVTDAVLYRLRGAGLNRARQRLAKATDDDTILSDIAADEEMLLELAEDFAERRISRAAFHAANDRVQVRLDAARAKLAAQSRPDVLGGIDDLAAEWQGLGLERQRAVIAAVLAEITVGPAVGPRNRFDPNRVSFRWRG
jgi:DNA invertase Pin-like site-specific DNA recombinase